MLICIVGMQECLHMYTLQRLPRDSCMLCCLPAGLFTYHKDSGYYWFTNGPIEDSYNEYHLVGLVSTF